MCKGKYVHILSTVCIRLVLYSGFNDRQALFSKVITEPSKPSYRKWSADSVYFIGDLCSDFQSCGVPLLNGVAVRFDFTLSDQNFFLLTASTGMHFELEDVTLHVPCAELSDELATKIQHRLEKEAAIMPFRRKQCVPFVIPSNTTVFLSDCK
jgi:hypothetical protein